MQIFASLSVFLLYAIVLTVPGGFSLGALMLVLGGGALLLPHYRPQIDAQDKRMLLALAVYFLTCAAMNLLHGAPMREYDAPMRFLLAIPALLFLRRFAPLPTAFWGGLAVGGIGTGLFAAYLYVVQIDPRVGGFTNPIQFGNLSFLLGILCLAGLFWARAQTRPRLWTALLLTGAALGMLASLLSGSRGSWLSLFFCLPPLYCYYAAVLTRRRLIIGAVVAVLVGIALFVMPHSPIRQRIELVATETSGYVDARESDTSVGARLEMWRTGIILIEERPLLGWGKKGYMDRAKALIADGVIGPVVADHSHLHNEYIDAWVKRGIPGLLSTLLLYGLPLMLFLQRYRHSSEAERPYILGGVLTVVSYIVFGLTQAFLTHDDGVTLYAFTVAILWSLARQPEA